MAQSATAHKTQILDFFYDDEDSCALTVLVNDVRFHIIVDPKDLRKSSDKNLYYEYLDKLTGLREAEQREEELTEKKQITGTRKNKNQKEKKSADKDSAVDVTADEDEEYIESAEDENDNDAEDPDQDSGSAQVELRNWILSAFADVTATWAPPDREPEESSLYDWYHGPTYFYNLQVSNGALEPELLETGSDLEQRIENLVPRMKMSKYIQQIDVPWLNSRDLIVKDEVNHPEPAHPGNVIDKEGNMYFFKPVVPSQPNPIKREIQILQKLAGLEREIRLKAPKLLGFVSFEESKTEAMGFLLSSIPNARPLTKLLDPNVSETKRKEWSKKSEEYIKELHKHGVIWGDAKADNFMVDENDELWIIDFGGSYTEGWVDPELQETKEGDDMGVGKVVAALEDPEKNTFDPAIGSNGSRQRGSERSEGEEMAISDVKETASSLFVTERKSGATKTVGLEEKVETGEKRKRRSADEKEEESKKVKGDQDGS